MIYVAVRDWVDRQWHASGMQFKILLLPALVPALLALILGRTLVLDVMVWTWFATWNAFVFWRYWFYVRGVSESADRHYDRTGKFNLAGKYHSTENASAARARKKKNG